MSLNKFPDRIDKWTLRRRRTLVTAAALALFCSGFAGLSAMQQGKAGGSAGNNDNTGTQAQPTVVTKTSKLIDTKSYRLTRGKIPVGAAPLQGDIAQVGKLNSVNSASIYNAGFREGYNRALNQPPAQMRAQLPVQSQPQSVGHPLTAVRPRAAQPLRDNRTFFQKHPMVKGAAIGAGIGTGAGALTGLVTGQGVFRGAAIGATTGAGVGVIRTSKIMKRHPIVRDIATGGVTGLGLGWAGSHYPHTIAATTGVGAAIGLGAGMFNYLR